MTAGTTSRVVLGNGVSLRTGELVRMLGARRVLLVTDDNLAEAAALVRGALASTAIRVDTWNASQPGPTVTNATELAAWASGRGCEAVVGLGGGSNLDLAKAAALLLAHGGELEAYAGRDRVPGPVLPMVAIPTTAGSGSEATGACLLAVAHRADRLAIVDDRLRPALALVDPELHRTCPLEVTRNSGVVALSHAIEALTLQHVEAREPAEQAIELIAHALPRALVRPRDLAARADMALGAWLAGTAIARTGSARIDALAHRVAARGGDGYGAVLLAVLDFVGADEHRRLLAVRDLLAAIGAPIDPQCARDELRELVRAAFA